MLVAKQLEKQRLASCEACPHYVQSTRTCGRLGLGKKIGDVRLCGCVMPVKVKLKTSKCPLDRWQRDVVEADLMKAKEIVGRLSGKHTIARNEIKALVEAYNSVTGERRQVTTCAPCLKSMLKDMKTAIEQGIE